MRMECVRKGREDEPDAPVPAVTAAVAVPPAAGTADWVTAIFNEVI